MGWGRGWTWLTKEGNEHGLLLNRPMYTPPSPLPSLWSVDVNSIWKMSAARAFNIKGKPRVVVGKVVGFWFPAGLWSMWLDLVRELIVVGSGNGSCDKSPIMW